MSENVLETQDKMIKSIEKYEEIAIFRHVRPDLDAVGSQVGLQKLIEATYPEKKVYTYGENVEWLSELIAPMSESAPKDFSDKLVIVLDTANTARLDGNFEKLQQAPEMIKIDHHIPIEDYGNIQWVAPEYSSVSEMVAKFWNNHKEQLKMTMEAAAALYAGIVGDTNRFLYDSTSPQTMQLAGELMEFGFDHAAFHFKLSELSDVERRLIAFALDTAQITEDGTGSIIFTKEKMEELDATDQDTSVIIPLIGNLKGVISWGVFVQQPNGGFRCRLRSKGPAINEIAALHDGGGHKLASGANAADLTEIQEIIEQLDAQNKTYH